MKKNLTIIGLLAAMLLMLGLAACEQGDETEDDYINDLKYKSKRALALQRLSGMKSKKAIPEILELMNRHYSTQSCIKTLGMIGDPIVLPDLKRLLDKVKTKQPKHLDRLTEEIAIAMGRIGDKQATKWLIEVVEALDTGALGRSGAIRALGMIGDVQAVEPLINFVVDESYKKKMPNRLLSMKSLFLLAHNADEMSKDTRQKLIEAMTVAMFIGEEGLNVFRESKEVMAALGGDDVVEWLIKTYKKENPKVEAYTDMLEKNYDFKKYYVQVKSLDVLGFIRNQAAAPFLLEVALDPKTEYILFAKAIQALERVGTPTTTKAVLEYLKGRKIRFYEDISAHELVARSLANTYDPQVIPYMMGLFKKGNVRLGRAKETFPQLCWSGAYVVAGVDNGSDYDEFMKIADAGKCTGEIDKVKKITAEGLIAQFKDAMELTQECGEKAECYANYLKTTADNTDRAHWGKRWKAVRMLVTLKANKYADALVPAVADLQEIVRYAAVDAVFRLLDKNNKNVYEQIRAFWTKDKNKEYNNNADLQKATEELGYTLQLVRQRLGLKEAVYQPFI